MPMKISLNLTCLTRDCGLDMYIDRNIQCPLFSALSRNQRAKSLMGLLKALLNYSTNLTL